MRQEQTPMKTNLRILIICLFFPTYNGVIAKQMVKSDTINVNIEVEETVIIVTIIYDPLETLKVIETTQGSLHEGYSKRFKIPVYLFPDGRILAIIKEGPKHSILLNSFDDFYLVRTRVSIYKLKSNPRVFYSVEYLTKKVIHKILEKYNGKEIPEYSNEHEKLYLLSNGKYLHAEYIDLGPNMDESMCKLYNSYEEITQLNLLERIKSRMSE
jgi:hypothetical protein